MNTTTTTTTTKTAPVTIRAATVDDLPALAQIAAYSQLKRMYCGNVKASGDNTMPNNSGGTSFVRQLRQRMQADLEYSLHYADWQNEIERLRAICAECSDSIARDTAAITRKAAKGDTDTAELYRAIARARAVRDVCKGDIKRLMLACDYSVSDAYDIVQESYAVGLALLRDGYIYMVLDTPEGIRPQYDDAARAQDTLYIHTTSKGIKRGYTMYQLMCKAARRYIHRYKPMLTGSGQYTYLADIVHDTDDISAAAAVLDVVNYKRSYRLEDISDIVSYDVTRQIIRDMGLTDNQADILRLRLRGMSQSEVARAQGVSPAAIKKVQKQMEVKLRKVAPDAVTEVDLNRARYSGREYRAGMPVLDSTVSVSVPADIRAAWDTLPARRRDISVRMPAAAVPVPAAAVYADTRTPSAVQRAAEKAAAENPCSYMPAVTPDAFILPDNIRYLFWLRDHAPICYRHTPLNGGSAICDYYMYGDIRDVVFVETKKYPGVQCPEFHPSPENHFIVVD